MTGSMKIARLGCQSTEQRRQVLEAARDEVHHVALALPSAMHVHEPGLQQRVALVLPDGLVADELDRSGLVLERNENNALGGLGLLSQRHDGACVCDATVLVLAQVLRRLEASVFQLGSKQREGMTAQREA